MTDRQKTTTIINNPSGPVNTGTGNQIIGSGVVITSDGNGIRQTITRKRKVRKNEE
jgi:hypothetical protein